MCSELIESVFQSAFLDIYHNKFDRAIDTLEDLLASTQEEQELNPTIKADILFAIAIYYYSIFKHKKAKEYMKKAKLAAGENSFRFSPIVDSFTLSNVKDLSLLSKLNDFIAENVNSVFLPLGYWCRAAVFSELDMSKESEKDIADFHLLYPDSSITFWLLKDTYTLKSDSSILLKNIENNLTLLPNNYILLINKGYVLHNLRRHKEAKETLFKALNIKLDKSADTYLALFISSLNSKREVNAIHVGHSLDHAILPEGYMISTFESFLPFINGVPNVIIKSLKDMKKKCVGSHKTFFLLVKYYTGLCLMKTLSFRKAAEKFRKIKMEIETNPPSKLLKDYLPAKCENKIEKCEIKHARFTRSIALIHRALTEACYRPGGPGYEIARAHFYSLAN